VRKASFFFSTVGLFLLLHGSFAHAISLDFVPVFQSVVAGNPVSVDLTISGLGDFAPPSLSTFDLDVSFDPAILAFSGVSFGLLLGDPSLREATTTVANSVVGLVNVFALSFLEGNSETCIFCIPPFLDDLQPASFTLATLTFNTLAEGVSPFTLSVNALGDAAGNPLAADVSGGSVTATAIPEPSTFLLLGSGLAGLLVFRRKLRLA
jgi:hypothetical protein